MAFLVYILGCSLRSFIRVAMIGSLWDLILSFRSSMRGRRSIGCIGSKVAFFCGVVCFSTCLTGWVNSSRPSLGSVTVFVAVVIFVEVAVRVRVIGVTVFVSRIVLIFFSLFSLLFQQATLISVMSWFFEKVARWLWSVGNSVCGLLAHSVYL